MATKKDIMKALENSFFQYKPGLGDYEHYVNDEYSMYLNDDTLSVTIKHENETLTSDIPLKEVCIVENYLTDRFNRINIKFDYPPSFDKEKYYFDKRRKTAYSINDEEIAIRYYNIITNELMETKTISVSEYKNHPISAIQKLDRVTDIFNLLHMETNNKRG